MKKIIYTSKMLLTAVLLTVVSCSSGGQNKPAIQNESAIQNDTNSEMPSKTEDAESPGHGFDAIGDEYENTFVARVAEFSNEEELAQFIKKEDFNANNHKADALFGETLFLIAPVNPQFTVYLYNFVIAENDEIDYDWENPIAVAEPGNVMIFSHTVPEGMPSIVVAVHSNSDGGHQTVWTWKPTRSGMDDSLILNDKFVKY